jgi:pimeloyl-ACP methyl ester carboxylesterase
MPAPIAMYRAGGFGVDQQPIAVPTLYITGADDGCALPHLADGQHLFTSAYQAEVWPGTGHFPHLEHPGRAAACALAWMTAHIGRGSEAPTRHTD